MDLSISRRRKQLNLLTQDNRRSLPNRVRRPSVLRAPRPRACWDCDARQRRSARPGYRGERDRESLFPREESRERRSPRRPREKTHSPHIAPEPAPRGRREAATKTEHSMMGCIRSTEPSSGSFPAVRRQSLAGPPVWAPSQQLPVPCPVPAIVRMRLPLDSGPNKFLSALTNALNPLPCACSGPLTPNSKTIPFPFSTH